MFAYHCPVLETETLVFSSAIRSLDNTDHGIIVHFDCPCGEHEGRVRTGRKAALAA